MHKLLGVVLCGGRATRMGGMDKGLVNLDGKPLAAYSIAALADCRQTIINANRHRQQYKDIFNLPVIADADDSFDGPLAGMLAALRYAQQHGFEWVISLPCDAPLVTADYVKHMWQATKHSRQHIFMADDGYRQPVFALLHVDIIAALETFLQGKHKKILLFYQQVGFATVDCSRQQKWFKNVNTLEELSTLENLQAL